MSDGLNNEKDHRHARYLFSGDVIDNEELTTACRRLGISEPFESFLKKLNKEMLSSTPHQSSQQQQQQQQQQQPQQQQQQQHKYQQQSHQNKQQQYQSVGADRNKDCSHTKKYSHTKSVNPFEITNNSNNNNINNYTKSGDCTYGQESWGRDSGARDLSPEPHRIPASNSVTDCQMAENESGTTSMIHLATKFQAAALSALKTEVIDVSTRLQQSEREREMVQRKLKEATDEKERSQRRLEAISASHESRITEMHCVIVELSKKLKNQKDIAIVEENDIEGSVSELSFQEGSVYNSDMECTNMEQESQTEPLDTKLVQPLPKSSESPCSLPPPVTSTQLQLQSMHEEILHLRGQVALLQSQLASDHDKFIDKEIDNNSSYNIDGDPITDVSPLKSKSIFNRNDNIHEKGVVDKIRSGAEHQQQQQQEQQTLRLEDNEFVRHAMAKHTKINKMALPSSRGVSPVVQLYGSINSLNNKTQQLQQKSQPSEIPVSKMAERVKLRRTIEENHITGTDIMNCGIYTTEIAEHLVSDLLQTDMMMIDNNYESPLLQTEVQRLQRRIEHLRIQNSVLSITLAESKAHSDHLYLLCGKYESNAIALHQALHCSDRAIEAYDVMLALLESRLGVLEDESSSASVNDSRKAAEAVARHLMDRLESEIDFHGNSLGPWQDAVVIYANNSTNAIPWTDKDDYRLRGHVSKLKGQRASIQNTVVILESPFMDDSEKRLNSKIKLNDASQFDSKRMDLETAVLMQELISMREEISEFKFRTEQAVREKNSAFERLAVMQEALMHLQAQLADSETLLAMSNKDRSSYSEAEHAAGIERELVEALARESRLKARLQGLAGSLEAAAKSSEEKYAQVQSTVSELKQANTNLTQSLDRCKRKYQTRLRRLEQQLLDVSIKAGGCSQSPLKNVPETTL